VSADIAPKKYVAGWQSLQFQLEFGWATKISAEAWRMV